MGVVYRCQSISKDEDTRLHKVITHVSKYGRLIMGDFNQPDIRCHSLDSSNDSAVLIISPGAGFTKPCALLKLHFLTSAYKKCMR